MSDTIMLIGIVGSEPETFVTSGGVTKATFRLASSQRYFSRARNDWVDSGGDPGEAARSGDEDARRGAPGLHGDGSLRVEHGAGEAALAERAEGTPPRP